MGQSRPGDMGFDIVHVNLHKSFSQPHGGGGPGAGPIAVSERIEPFLPRPQVVRREGDNGGGPSFDLDHDRPKSIGRLRGFQGNFGVFVRSYAYILSLGADGLAEASETAVLNANYLKARLAEGRAGERLPVAFDRHCMHEFVLSGKPMKRELGIATLDLAKRLLDFGFHPPTVYFPLLVDEALMVEPTETETKESLDAFADAIEADPRRGRGRPRERQAGPLHDTGAPPRRGQGDPQAGRPPAPELMGSKPHRPAAVGARVAEQEDIPAVTETMALAFYDDPVWGWAFPDAERRLEQHRAVWRLVVESSVSYGWAWLTEGCAAAALWIPPGRPELRPEDEERIGPLLEEAMGDGAARVLDTFERFDAAHPDDRDHFYLSLLGTHPDRRGKGIGMGLLAETLDRIDASGRRGFPRVLQPGQRPPLRRARLRILRRVRARRRRPDGHPDVARPALRAGPGVPLASSPCFSARNTSIATGRPTGRRATTGRAPRRCC